MHAFDAAKFDQAVARLPDFAEALDENRCAPPELIRLMHDAGLFKIFLPLEFGGFELGMIGGLDLIEQVATANPTVGWLMLKAASSNMLCGRLSRHIAEKIWTSPDVVLTGNLNPKRGQARAVDGGFLLTGSWDWGTCSQFAEWMSVAALIMEDDKPAGARIFLVPSKAFAFQDVWRTYGMRGTASTEYGCNDLFVEEDMAIDISAPGGAHPIYDKVPFWSQVMVPHAPLAIGTAQGCLNELLDLAKGKTSWHSSKSMQDKELVQHAIGQAQGIIAAARAYLKSAVNNAWNAESFSADHALHLSLSATFANQECTRAVDLLTQAAGGTAVYLQSPIQRHFRDIHVAATHAAISIERYAGAGRMALGVANNPM